MRRPVSLPRRRRRAAAGPPLCVVGIWKFTRSAERLGPQGREGANYEWWPGIALRRLVSSKGADVGPPLLC